MCNVRATPAEGKALIPAYNLFFLHLSFVWNHLPYATEHIALVSSGTETQVQTLFPVIPVLQLRADTLGHQCCSWSPPITKLLSSPGLHSFVGFGDMYEILPPEEGKVKPLWSLSGSGFCHMPSGYCHQYFYANGSHLMIPSEVLPPEKAFLLQHQDTSSRQTTNMVFQESVTLLHINYISVSYDQDAINVSPRNNVTDGNPLPKRKLHGIWYLTESNFNLCVGNNCTRKKVCVLIAQAGDSNFCASLKLFKTWLYPCFIELVMFVPYIWHNLPLLNLWWKSKQNLAQPHHLLNCSTLSFFKIIISFFNSPKSNS